MSRPLKIIPWMYGIILFYAFWAPNYWFNWGGSLFDNRRLWQVIWFAVAGLSILLLPSVRQAALNRWFSLTAWVRWGLGGLLLIGCLSALINAIVPSVAFMGVSFYTLAGISCLVLGGYFYQYPGHWRYLLYVFYVLIVLYVGHIITYMVFMTYDPSYTMAFKIHYIHDLFRHYHFSNPRFFDHLLTFLWPLAILPCLQPNQFRRSLQWAGLLVTALVFFLIIAHQLRAVALEWFAVLFVLIVFVRNRLGWRFIGYQVLALMLGILLIYFVQIWQMAHLDHLITQTAASRNAIHSNSERLYLIRIALSAGLSHPLVGVGSWQTPYYLQAFFFGDAEQAQAILPLYFHLFDYVSVPTGVSSVHGFFWRVLSEWGVIAFIGVMSMIVYGLWRWVVARGLSSGQSLTFAMSLIAGLAHALVSGTLLTPLGVLVGSLVIGLALSTNPTQSPKALCRWRQWGLMVVATIAIVGLLCPLLYQQTLLQHVTQVNPYTKAPVFWSVGWWSVFYQ